MNELKCTKTVEHIVRSPVTNKIVERYSKLCGEPAAEYEFGGMLTKAKAVLCSRHREQAARQSWVSVRGYSRSNAFKRYSKLKGEARAQARKPERQPQTGLLTLTDDREG